MNIGLVDVDGHHFPNLALGKIAAFHRSIGDTVEWASPLFGNYDHVYMSKVFSFTPDCMDVYNCEVVKGGTGYDYTTKLPDYIDRLQPDYSIYPNIDRKTAYGFLTRGCPNKCPWCIVPKKEGNITPYMDVDEIAIQQDVNVVKQCLSDFMDIVADAIPNFADWAEQTKSGERHYSHIDRVISDYNIQCLQGFNFRLNSIAKNGKEFQQPYFRSHQKEATKEVKL